jgi:hypothetical protein
VAHADVGGPDDRVGGSGDGVPSPGSGKRGEMLASMWHGPGRLSRTPAKQLLAWRSAPYVAASNVEWRHPVSECGTISHATVDT